MRVKLVTFMPPKRISSCQRSLSESRSKVQRLIVGT
jgi:hypothetical protein